MPSYKELLAQIEALKQQADTQRRAEVQSAIMRAKEIIVEYQLTVDDLGMGAVNHNKPAQRKRAPAAIKYQDLASGRTWTGRGRMPQWLLDAEAQGGSRDQFLVRQ